KDIISHSKVHNNDESNDSSLLNFQSQLNGTVANKNTLLLELDPDAPNSINPMNTDTPSPNDPFKQFSNQSSTSQQNNQLDTLLDFDSSNNVTNKHEQETNLTNFNNPFFDINPTNTNENFNIFSQSNESEEQLLRQASQELDDAVHELSDKLDLITAPSPPLTPDQQQQQQPVVSTIEEHQSAISTKTDSTV
ncbi:unnamed protein product, partial [Rotaria sp. Silwood1]